MKFTKRDYLVSAAIIIGVLAAWFLLIAVLLGITDPQIGFTLATVIGFLVYVALKRRNSKNSKDR